MLKLGSVAPSFKAQGYYIHILILICFISLIFCGLAVMPDLSISEVSLSSFVGSKYLWLIFYPLDFSIVCPTEILEFSKSAEKFQKDGCELLLMSVDSEFTHLAYRSTSLKDGGIGSIDVPLLSDLSHSISCEYGVLNDGGFANRASVLIDKKGVCRALTMVDDSIGRSADEHLRLFHAVKFVDDNNGAVNCPASWRPGQTAIKNDFEGMKSFLRQMPSSEDKK